jgi:repressor LexA
MVLLSTPSRPLTPRQRQVLEYLYSFTLAHGYQPGARQILEYLNVRSLNAHSGHLHALERAGYVRQAPHRSRSVEFLKWPDGAPFMGFARPDPAAPAPDPEEAAR